jgi:hypothetical protein
LVQTTIAIGTLAAALIALCLARRQDEIARRHAQERAILAAAGIAIPLSDVLEQASVANERWQLRENIRGQSTRLDKVKTDQQLFRDALRQISESVVFFLSADTQIALLALPNQAAARIQAAASLVTNIRRSAAIQDEVGWNALPMLIRNNLLDTASSTLSRMIELLEVAEKEVAAAAQLQLIVST